MTVVYMDTSAFMKRFFTDEDGSEATKKLLSRAEFVASSVLLWPEGLAALARRHRLNEISSGAHSVQVQQFSQALNSLALIELDSAVQMTVREIIDAHPLRALDAIHLASAATMRDSGLELTFVCSDKRLLAAALAEGFAVFDPANPDSST